LDQHTVFWLSEVQSVLSEFFNSWTQSSIGLGHDFWNIGLSETDNPISYHILLNAVHSTDTRFWLPNCGGITVTGVKEMRLWSVFFGYQWNHSSIIQFSRTDSEIHFEKFMVLKSLKRQIFTQKNIFLLWKCSFRNTDSKVIFGQETNGCWNFHYTLLTMHHVTFSCF
jgi:hypothetical protein